MFTTTLKALFRFLTFFKNPLDGIYSRYNSLLLVKALNSFCKIESICAMFTKALNNLCAINMNIAKTKTHLTTILLRYWDIRIRILIIKNVHIFLLQQIFFLHKYLKTSVAWLSTNQNIANVHRFNLAFCLAPVYCLVYYSSEIKNSVGV